MWTRLQAGVSRLTFAFARRRLDDDTRREIDTHLDLLTDRYVRQGLSRDQAWLAARRQFGSVTLVREELHTMNSIGWVERILGDLRDGGRQLRRSPGFVVVAATVLALGIGGATAVFSIVQAVLLAPLPYDEPGQLVRLYQQRADRPDSRDVLAGTHFSFVREQAASFDEVAALAHYSETGLDLVVDGRAERLRVLAVSTGYFQTLRAALPLGREFERDDETGTRRVVLGDAVWRTRFGADPAVVGRTIRLSGESYQVAGVAAPGFEDPFARDVAAWIPYALARDTYEENNSLTAIGRLRHGVTLDTREPSSRPWRHPCGSAGLAPRRALITLVPLQEELVSDARGPLHLVFAAVALVLLIACVNVANLALVRATGHMHEFAVRASLGSSRYRLARQLLVEHLLLAGVGGIVGPHPRGRGHSRAAGTSAVTPCRGSTRSG